MVWLVAAGAPVEPTDEIHPVFRPPEDAIRAAIERGRDAARKRKKSSSIDRPYWRTIRRTTVKGFRTVTSGRVMWGTPLLFAEQLGYRAEKLRMSDDDLECATDQIRAMCMPQGQHTGFVVNLTNPHGRRSRTEPVGFVLAVDGGGEYPADDVRVGDSGVSTSTEPGLRTVPGWGRDPQGGRYTWYQLVPSTRERRQAYAGYTALFSLFDEDGSPRVPPSAQWIELKVVFETRERAARFDLPKPAH